MHEKLTTAGTAAATLHVKRLDGTRRTRFAAAGTGRRFFFA